jgi:hypothetical protein
MRVDKFSTLDLLDLPEQEQSIVRYLMGHESTTGTGLQEALQASMNDVDLAIEGLLEKGWLTRSADGRLEAVAGQVKRRTSLPPQFWSPFSANSRSFSGRDIQMLRVAIPILQFARSKMAEFNDHGPTHALRVRDYAAQLGYIVQLTPTEHFFLRVAAMFHDIGNIIDRKSHHIVSQQSVERLAAQGLLPLNADEAAIAGLICRWHRKGADYDPTRIDRVGEESVRTGLLGALIRVADAMDIDVRRSDYSAEMRSVLEFFFPAQRQYFTSLEEVCGVRIHCAPDVRIQVFTCGPATDNMQITMLQEDLASTLLSWTIEKRVLGSDTPVEPDGRKALLAFPFDAHSLIMAAISRKHLRAAGFEVKTVCYADTVESAQALWRDDLGDSLSRDLTHIVVVGGTLQASDAALVTSALSRLMGRSVQVSLLNRHEQSWSWSPWLLQSGVDLVLGGDWAYFWGDQADSTDMFWARVAALCGRDPAQAALRFTEQEYSLANGLLLRMQEQLRRVRFDESADWVALSEPLIRAIEQDDHAYFEQDAENYRSSIVSAIDPVVQGRALVFHDVQDVLPNDLYWMLEAAIERQGLALEHGIQFRVPYAIALRSAGNAVELLAIRHWREEVAPAIRFLFPNDAALVLQGNENTVWVRVAAERAADLVRDLIAACNC